MDDKEISIVRVMLYFAFLGCIFNTGYQFGRASIQIRENTSYRSYGKDHRIILIDDKFYRLNESVPKGFEEITNSEVKRTLDDYVGKDY